MYITILYKLRYYLTIVFSIYGITIHAQLPHEKSFVVTDRTMYRTTDSVTVNGRIVSGNADGSNFSRYVYVDVINPEDTVIVRKKINCGDDGLFATKIGIDYNWGSGIYYLRAYTKFMLNFNETTINAIPFAVGVSGLTLSDGVLLCTVFPEGGSLSPGMMQRLSIYIADNTGRGRAAPFSINDDQGNEILTSETSSSGWKTVSLMPQSNSTLTLNVTSEGTIKKYALPPITAKPHLQAIMGQDKIAYKILSMQQTDDYKLFMYNASVGLVQIPKISESGICHIDRKLNGVVTMMLTDRDGNLLSESSSWHRPTEDSGSATTDTTIVRYIPAEEAMLPQTSAEQQIYFDSDYKSDCTFPTSFLTSDDRQKTDDANAWLMSARITRIDPKLSSSGVYDYRFTPETNLQIAGKVTTVGRKTLKKGFVVALSTENGLANDTIIPKDGHFVLDIPDFRDGDAFFVQAGQYKGKPEDISVSLDKDTIPYFTRPILPYLTTDASTKAVMTAGNSKGEIYLGDVIVSARRKRVKLKAHDVSYKNRYVSYTDIANYNLQSLGAIVQTFFFTNFALRTNAQNQTDLVSRRASALNIMTDGEQDIEEYGISNTVPVVLDGVQMKFYEAEAQCNVSDIVSVEYLSAGMTLAEPGCFGCINGALIVKTGKKGTAQKRLGDYVMPTGITENMYGKLNHPPLEKGKYIKLSDIIRPDGTITSHAETIEITDR